MPRSSNLYRLRADTGKYEYLTASRPGRMEPSGTGSDRRARYIVRQFHGPVVSEDITVRIRSEQALSQAEAEAERANPAESEFLAPLSHEIWTSISGIIGMTDLLTARVPEGNRKEQYTLLREAAGSLPAVICDMRAVEDNRINRPFLEERNVDI